MKIFRSAPILSCLLFFPAALAIAQVQSPAPRPDDRLKADILLVVAHPDDDTAVSACLAKAVLDENKRVAAIFTTRGNAGPNAIGMEQSKALSDVREMEARRSLADRGITNVWFLEGQDTPTQDVLHSLETLGHGAALEEMVRLIRLTRPEVILTWLPAYVAGENHGDHQASGVVAVEAFDLAGDPSAFPEQVTPPRSHDGINNYGEGLHPWQAKKLYFFSDATHPDFLKGRGPTCLATEISPSQNISYAEIGRRAWKQYATQLDFNDATLKYFVEQPEILVLGKSYVTAPDAADLLAGIGQGPIPFHPAPGHRVEPASGVTLELGGPWAYYKRLYEAHGLDRLQGLVPPQTSLGANHQLWVPLLIQNDSPAAGDVTLHADLPAGWSGDTNDRTYHLDAGSTYPVQLFLTAPAGQSQQSPQALTWTITGTGVSPQKLELSVFLESNGVPQ